MKERICYILYTNERRQITTVENNRFIITIIKTNIKNAISLLLGTRYSIIYCDTEFTKTISGQELIRNIIKPCLCVGKKEFYLI